MSASSTLRRNTSPLFDNGDEMKADEFHRRYSLMPDVKRAELLDGVVYMPSPVRFDHHGEPHAQLMGWLCCYKAATRGLLAGDNSTLRLDEDNEVQPDAMLLIPSSTGGQTQLIDDYVHGAPELICEVASSSVRYDLGLKKDLYVRFGVRELIVWRAEAKAIDWFLLRDRRFVSHVPDPDDIFRSTVFPGLWLDWKALLTGDLARVFAVVQQGCATPEHAALVQRLASK